MCAMSSQLLRSGCSSLGAIIVSLCLLGTGWAATMPWQLLASLQPAEQEGSHIMALAFATDKPRYYLVDSGLSRLLSFDQQGKFLQEFTANGDLQEPISMVRLGKGRIVVVERGRNCLSMIDLVSKKIKRITPRFQGREIFCDRLQFLQGKLYVLDRLSGALLVLDDSLQVVGQYLPPAQSHGFTDFTVYKEQVWCLATGEQWLYGFTIQGERLFKRLDLQEIHLDFPVSFTMDKQGDFFILDRHQGQVTAIDQTGRKLYSFLRQGYGEQFLSYPAEIRFDPWGRLCIVDQGNNRVQVFSR